MLYSNCEIKHLLKESEFICIEANILQIVILKGVLKHLGYHWVENGSDSDKGVYINTGGNYAEGWLFAVPEEGNLVTFEEFMEYYKTKMEEVSE